MFQKIPNFSLVVMVSSTIGILSSHCIASKDIEEEKSETVVSLVSNSSCDSGMWENISPRSTSSSSIDEDVFSPEYYTRELRKEITSLYSSFPEQAGFNPGQRDADYQTALEHLSPQLTCAGLTRNGFWEVSLDTPEQVGIFLESARLLVEAAQSIHWFVEDGYGGETPIGQHAQDFSEVLFKEAQTAIARIPLSTLRKNYDIGQLLPLSIFLETEAGYAHIPQYFKGLNNIILLKTTEGASKPSL